MNLWIQHEMALETLRSAIPGGPRGWHPVRLIFRDFWHWRDYELGFAHGRLALTGQNRGGKSSILGLVIPALLDGDTSPSRLDPSQSRDRHIHWYLLGHEHLDPDQPGVFAKRARTGYIALEFRHGETGRYLTIGMGFSAARHVQRRIRDWCGFVLPDLRLGRDLDVRGADGNCLEPREFIRRLGPPAVATGDRAEYRRQVNRHLFGMTDDDYAALISMLLQARRPKLGEQAGPDQVCLLLRDALPGIPPERLDQVAEVVHNIEEYQRNLEDVARRAACVEELDRLLLELAEVLVQKAAAEFASAQGRHGSLAARLQQAREQLQRAEGERQAAAAQLAAVEARLGEVRARLAVLREHDAAELPLKLQAEEQEVRDLERRLDFLREQLEAERRILDQHHRALRELAERFGAQVRRIGQRLTALGHRARSSGWEAGARELMDAAAALDPLRVDAAPADLEAARPDPAIAPEGQDLVRQYRELARLRAGVEAAEAEYRQRQDRADSLRAQQEELTERVRQAEEEADARREALVAALRAWQERSPALEVPDPVLAGVIRAVQALAAAPERGYEALVEGIRNLAAKRQRHLEAALAEAALEQARAEVQMAALAERLAELGRTGLVPDRSELRRRARSAAPEDPSWRPLFRWVRFRPGVPPEVAARVEAAALEAGLLDLLLAPPAEDAADPAPDAWAVPAPLTGVPTLLEVMEPEPGAPERVAQVLASVGWGEGPGDRWIAPDGRWRHGIACGQVAPWLTEPTGLVGEERRQAALQARLAALRQARDAWQAERDAAIRRQEELRQQMAALGEELRALADLPWQALFDALTRVDQLRGQAEEARRQVEAARGEAEAALRRYQAEEDRYQAAARHLPEARGLTAAGLSQRAEAIEGLLRDLQDLDEEYRALHQVMADHRERRQLREEAAARIAARQAEIADTQRRLGAARQRVRALEERLRDPEMVRLRQDIDALAAEERRLEEAARELAERRQALETKVAASQAQIKTVAPEEAEARAEVAARLQHLRQRLQLHPALADLAAALDRDGPVTTLPRLPRPVESPARLEEEIERRRTALLEFQLQYRDLLSDYRPARAHGGDSLVFYEEREPLTATELLRRLRAREEQYRTYLAEEEQKLYERIIYQGILDDIRKRIRQAHHFTRLTNEKLRQLRLGGEWLSLRLSVASGDEVPGARIARMLEQVDQSSEWLAEEQREALLGLIRAEVERVRQEAAARGEAISYHDAIREALDYRRWYQYQLLSHTRNHPQGVPIRNRGFGTRSQSARAWALAVPVIAGVAARYEASPRPDVPRLIALDEAFAGFDPQNQAAYLKFLCDLNFCWLITCPDELPYSADLSAAMAYRMTLDEEQGLHYGYPILWDGRQVREPLAELADPDSAAEAAADREPAGPGEGEEP